MKIVALFHTLTFPPESGVTKRTFHLLEELARRHEVTVVAAGSATDAEGVRARLGDRCPRIVFVDGRRPRWVNLLVRIWLLVRRRSLLRHSLTRRFQAALDEVFAADRFDAVFLSSPLMGYYRRPAGLPLVTDTHNVEYDMAHRFYRQARNPVSRLYLWDQYRLLRRDELAACAGGDALLTTSERDRTVFAQDLPHQKIHVIPNGVDLDTFAPSAEEPVPHSMVFTGLMGYRPNSEGITWFLDQVFPLIQAEVPDATLAIVGSGPSRALLARASDRITVTGWVKDIRPYVSRGQVYLVPLLVGGGTRLKALEAMAMRKPIVTTSVGCEGIDLVPGESALFEDDPRAFAAAVVRLFRDRDLRTRLAGRAHALAAERYGWGAIGELLDRVVRAVAPAAERAGSPPLHALRRASTP
jgi:glycosyltransferase involved in cell wall biosynthesis